MQGHLIAVVSGYTFEACIFGQNEFHSGSRRSQDVVEVVVLVVLATVVEVVVHATIEEVDSRVVVGSS